MNNSTHAQRELGANAFRASHEFNGPILKAGDQVMIGGRMYTAGSVVSYSIEKGDCPVLAVERAFADGHKLWWLNQNAVTISNPPIRVRDVDHVLSEGDVVKMEGRFLMVVSAPNRNFNLVPLTADELAYLFDFEKVSVPA